VFESMYSEEEVRHLKKQYAGYTDSIEFICLLFVFSVLLLFGYRTNAGAGGLAQLPRRGFNTQVQPTLHAFPWVFRCNNDITGGTRPVGGTNLFHSFGDFNVPNNNIANFLNSSGLATSNILGRVTGGNLSNIFGTIQTTGFGNANLFLMNPAGFLFGPNATVNVGGMVSFTSADYLRLADGVRFNAAPNAAADALLTAAPVAAFGFLGSNPGALTVQGSQLTVTEGTGLSLVGEILRFSPAHSTMERPSQHGYRLQVGRSIWQASHHQGSSPPLTSRPSQV
jgi:filamentous hemagglutinin family protein